MGVDRFVNAKGSHTNEHEKQGNGFQALRHVFIFGGTVVLSSRFSGEMQ